MPDKGFDITKTPKYDEYQRGIASMVDKCFDKKNVCYAWKVGDVSYVSYMKFLILILKMVVLLEYQNITTL